MFQAGDKVMLNSGGPVMTVIGVSRNERVWCEWLRGDGQIDESSFIPATLSKVN